MTSEMSKDEIVASLKAVQSRQSPASKVGQICDRLLHQLSSPVRITLLGPKGAGKRRLCNALLGTDILPEDMPIPTFELMHGDAESISATLSDRSERTVSGREFADVLDDHPSLLRVFAPIPMLRDLRMLVLMTDDWQTEALPAAKWAAPRTDMVIWVAQDFDSEQQALWQQMPATISDHAMLALTSELSAPESDTAAQINQDNPFGSEFLGVYRVSLGAAPASDGSGPSPDCRALSDPLMQHLERARQADLDRAMMLINRFGSTARGPKPSPEAPAPAEHIPVVTGTQDAPVPEPLPQQPAHDPPEENLTEIPTAQPEALELLRNCAKGVLSEIDALDETEASELVLDRCVDAADELCQILPPNGAVQDFASQAADYLLLLKLENDDSASEEALIAMLQLKRSVEGALAA